MTSGFKLASIASKFMPREKSMVKPRNAGMMLEVDDLVVSYGAIKALKGISFGIAKGEIVSFIGANGAGKSTLLNSIASIVEKSAGSVFFEGRNITHSKTNGIVKSGICLVPEGRRVFADLTVDENLDMGAYTIDDKKVIDARKEEMFSIFEILKARREQKAATLSGGEQQMLAIARALMSSPRLILLDEPGLGLAPLMVEAIFRIISDISKKNDVTILLVEQNAKMALKASTRAFVMESGNIVLEGSGDELLKSEKVRKAYLGE